MAAPEAPPVLFYITSKTKGFKDERRNIANRYKNMGLYSETDQNVCFKKLHEIEPAEDASKKFVRFVSK